ncbi:MAG: TenA family transcriptional regulator [Gammaproteobacteria bacterium]
MTDETPFQRLQAATEAERDALLAIPFLREGMAGNISLNSYVAFLTQAYHHVKHTVPLLMLCGAHLSPEREWLRNAMAEYIEEELGHQEWILNDIAACAGDAEAVRHEHPGSAAEVLVAYAYYVIEHVDPIAFLGMVHVLEGTSIKAATQAAGNIQKNLGLPNEAFSYLNSHGSLDLEHVDFFTSLVNRMGDDDLDTVIRASKVFYTLYGNVFRGLPLELMREAA